MPDSTPAHTTPRKKRRWLRRLLWTFLVLFLLLVCFHRLIIHHGGRWAAIYFAKKEHLALDLRIEGNLWSHFEIRDLRATRLPTGPSPIERLSLDRLALDYDVMKLIRGDLNGLRVVEIGTVEGIITPLPSTPPPTPEPPTPLADTLRTILAKPLPAPKVVIQRVDLQVKDPGGDLVVKNFHLALTPEAPGQVSWEGIEIPGVKPLPAFAGRTRFASGSLIVDEREGGAPFLALKTSGPATDSGGQADVEINLLGIHTTIKAGPAATGPTVSSAVAVGSIDVRQVLPALGLDLPASGVVSGVQVSFDGDPAVPASWKLEVATGVNGAGYQPIDGVDAKFRLAVRNLTLQVEEFQIQGLGATLSAQGTLPLPASFAGDQAIPQDGSFSFQLAAPDLAPIGSKLNTPLAGQIAGRGTVDLVKGQLTSKISLDATNLAASGNRIEKATIQLDAGLPLTARPSLRQLVATASAQLGRVITEAAEVEQVRVRATLRDLEAKVEEARVERGESYVAATASVKLTEEGQLASKPVAQFSVLVPSLADFALKANGALLSGAFTSEGTLTVEDPIIKSQGEVYLRASRLQLGDAPVGELIVDLQLTDSAVIAKKIEAELTGNTTIDATGRTSLVEPYPYGGKLVLNAPDLAAFAPILEQLGQKIPLSGQVKVNVQGDGDFTEPDGEVRVEAKNVRYDTTEINETTLAATFSPTAAETQEFSVVMGKLRAIAKLVWKDKRFALSNLDLKLDNTTVLSGELSVPLDPTAPKPLPTDQPIQAKFATRNLDVAKVMASLGQAAPIAGTVTLDLDAGGTLAQPKLLLTAKASQVRALPPPPDPKQSKIKQPQPAGTSTKSDVIPPTDLETKVTLENQKLLVTGLVRQPLIQPLTFNASTTLAVGPLLEGQPFDVDQLPLQASVDLPASSLAFLPRLAPAVAKIDGTATIALRVSGTVDKPSLQGTTNLDLKTVRLANGAVPVLTNFRGRLTFAQDRLTLTEFGGEAGGGRFSASGGIGLAKLSEPVFDLALKSKDVLVLRDDMILVRAETDLTLKGPLPTATAAGTVFITDSRINKEVEILPLSLPGKPKPVPKVAAQATRISFPDPPLRDWKFDIAVKTRSDDPFQIRGNLARGKVMLDVRLSGTGLNPYLTGAATIDQFSATLPLSTLTTRRGVVTFSQENPFQPYVELEAESRIRQYLIIARVTGPATKPQLDLESEPPLPQQEILSLLTTGSLTGEIGANNTALATRAAVLVVKSWYKKLFKKDFPLGDDDGGDSILDRFEVDFGAVDPKTGRNETTAQIRFTDRLFFIGDLEMGGGFSGRVKYLFRFR